MKIEVLAFSLSIVLKKERLLYNNYNESVVMGSCNVYADNPAYVESQEPVPTEEHNKIANNYAEGRINYAKSREVARVKELSAQYGEILAKKRDVYKTYKAVKNEMKQWSIAARNVEMILGLDEKNQMERSGKTR